MFNPYKQTPSIADILRDPVTNTPSNTQPRSASELKKLCDASNDLKLIDKCMHNVPAYIQMIEESYKGTISIEPRYAEDEAYKEKLLKTTFNSYNVINRDEKVLTTTLLACTNAYYTNCVKNLQ
jgi:hypothetical protein